MFLFHTSPYVFLYGKKSANIRILKIRNGFKHQEKEYKERSKMSYCMLDKIK